MNASLYTLTIIKPDAHKDILAEIIIQDLRASDFKIVFRKDIALSNELAEQIYREHKNDPNFEYAVKSLLGDEKNKFSTLIILKLLKGNDALEKIQEFKGRSDEGGIRLKYRFLSKQELEEKGYKEENLKKELAKNRLHTVDTHQRELEIIDMLLNESEKQDLKEREPEFYQELLELKENKEIRRELLEFKKFVK